MFGRGKKHGMTENEKFVMERGMKAGNVRPPPMKKDPPTKAKAVVNKAGLKGREQLGTIKVRP